MKINSIKQFEILEFEEKNNYILQVNERPEYLKLPKYYVSFKYCESMERGVLISYSGEGSTVDKAIKDYCKKISNKIMVFNAFSYNRSEVVFPKLVHTKLLKK